MQGPDNAAEQDQKQRPSVSQQRIFGFLDRDSEHRAKMMNIMTTDSLPRIIIPFMCWSRVQQTADEVFRGAVQDKGNNV